MKKSKVVALKSTPGFYKVTGVTLPAKGGTLPTVKVAGKAEAKRVADARNRVLAKRTARMSKKR